jgi:hypothetical protein
MTFFLIGCPPRRQVRMSCRPGVERVSGVPYYCVNAASYFWYNGMRPYTKPLFAFMLLGTDGVLKVEGVSGEFAKPPPRESDSVPGRSASIQRRGITTRASTSRVE